MQNFYDELLNPAVQEFVSKHPEYFHWKNVEIHWDLMKEDLVYTAPGPGRHCDHPELMDPAANNPDDGFVALINLGVNGTINPDGTYTPGTEPKEFCVCRLNAKNTHPCSGTGNARSVKAHYKIYNTTIIIMGKRAAYWLPHRPENILKGTWTIVLVSRNNFVKLKKKLPLKQDKLTKKKTSSK